MLFSQDIDCGGFLEQYMEAALNDNVLSIAAVDTALTHLFTVQVAGIPCACECLWIALAPFRMRHQFSRFSAYVIVNACTKRTGAAASVAHRLRER